MSHCVGLALRYCFFFVFSLGDMIANTAGLLDLLSFRAEGELVVDA